MESPKTTDSLGRLASRIPAASRVFMRHGLDFCCSGNRPLDEVCEDEGLDAAAIVDEIEAERAGDDGDVCWDDKPLGELIDHILASHHRPLDEELPRLDQMVRRVVTVHGDKDPERLHDLARTFTALREDLTPHMMKEERVLFPWIQSGDGRTAGQPVQVMLYEHESAGEMLDRLRELTDGFQPPQGACNTWRALYAGLDELDTSLREHIHLENNILFPRALAGEAA
ncbi:MAG: iron-sulfur cluster repair di-iron protein [Myxococcota bacterium]